MKPSTLAEQRGLYRPLNVVNAAERKALSGLATGAIVRETGAKAVVTATYSAVEATYTGSKSVLAFLHRADSATNLGISIYAYIGASNPNASYIYVAVGESGESVAAKVVASLNKKPEAGTLFTASASGATMTVTLEKAGEVVLNTLKAAFAAQTLTTPGFYPTGSGWWRLKNPAQAAADAGWEIAGAPTFADLPKISMGSFIGAVNPSVVPDLNDYGNNYYEFPCLIKSTGFEWIKNLSFNWAGRVSIQDVSGLTGVETFSASFYLSYNYGNDYPLFNFGAMKPITVAMTGLGYNNAYSSSSPPIPNCERLLSYDIWGSLAQGYEIENILQAIIDAGLSNGYLNVLVSYYQTPNYTLIYPTVTYQFEDITLADGETESNRCSGTTYTGNGESTVITAAQQVTDAGSYAGSYGDSYTDNGDGSITISQTVSYGNGNYYNFNNSTQGRVSYPSVETLEARGWQVEHNEAYNPFY